MQQKDHHIRFTSKLLNGIKVIKLYAWEDHFQSDVKDTRDSELSVLRIITYLNAGLSFTWSSTLFLVKVCDDSIFEEYISTHVYAYTIIVKSFTGRSGRFQNVLSAIMQLAVLLMKFQCC